MSTILVSVAHSKASPGAQNNAVSEYLVSQRATISLWRSLAGEHETELYDAGPLNMHEYDDAKIACVNACQPKLALELHLNSSEKKSARYGEVIYRKGSVLGQAAAEAVMDGLARGMAMQGIDWIARGARPSSIAEDGHTMFFLERTQCPAILVEGFFVSNDLQAAWLTNRGGQDLYGQFVADGLKRWLGLP